MYEIKFFGGLIDQIIYAVLIFSFFQFVKIVIKKVLYKVFDKFVAKTESTFDDEILEVLKRPIDVLFIFLGLKFALEVLPISETFTFYANHIIKSVFALIIFWTIYNLIKPLANVIQTFTSRFGKDLSDDITNLIRKTLQFLVIAIGFAAVMKDWGYDISGFLASLGLVGMAFALAAKDTAANLFGSLVIFTDKPFRVGEWIHTPNVEGIVEEIGIRSTKVRTFAQALVTVPNAVLANSAILNWSKMGKRRIKMKIGLTYSTTNEQMQSVVADIKNMLKNHPDIDQETIHIYFTDFMDSSLGIFCYYFTKSTNWGEYMRVREDTNLKIMKIVEANNANFAFPSQSIYIENLDENKQIG